MLKRFFDQIPRDVLEAAEIDGAGRLRTLWSIVLPLSRPVLGVVSIFALVAVWQDFLWPLMVFSDTDKQPISVALVQLSQNVPLTVLIGAMVIASIPMVLMFLVFQRHIAGISAGEHKRLTAPDGTTGAAPPRTRRRSRPSRPAPGRRRQTLQLLPVARTGPHPAA